MRIRAIRVMLLARAIRIFSRLSLNRARRTDGDEEAQSFFTEGNKGNKNSVIPNLKTFVIFVPFC